MNHPVISVIVPVFNGAQTIDRCLASIESQSFANFEIIVIDDGSNDETLSLLGSMRLRDDRIRVYSTKHSGVSLARMKGVAHARGDLISFVDSDDFVAPVFLEKLYCAQRVTGADIVECARTKIGAGELPLWTESSSPPASFFQPELLIRVLQYKNHSIGLWNKIYSRSLFEGLTWPKVSSHEDEAVLPLLAERAVQMAQIDDCCYAYVQRDGSISHLAANDCHVLELLSILDERFRRYSKMGIPEIDIANRDCINAVCTDIRNNKLRSQAIEERLASMPIMPHSCAEPESPETYAEDSRG